MTEILEQGMRIKEDLAEGINKLANMVKVTLGPRGRNVIMKNSFGEYVITKDGVSVAKEIFLEDETEAMGAELVKKVSIKANDEAGDGTTTATILAQALYNKGIKLLKEDYFPLDIKEGLDAALLDILKLLEKDKKDVKIGDDTLIEVALIASNGDKKVAQIYAEIYSKLGEEAVITVNQGDALETYINIVQGLQFDNGYISPYCINDITKMKATLEHPLFLFFDGKLSSSEHIFAYMEHAAKEGRPLIIVAEDVKEEALRSLAINHQQGKLQSALVKAPGFGDRRRSLLLELATITGGSVHVEGMQQEITKLGSSESIEITGQDTVIVGGKGNAKEVDALVKGLKEKIAQPGLDNYLKEKYEESLGKILGGVAVINVGANSKTELKELYDRIEDTRHATKSALKGGVVEGGGVALSKIKLDFKEHKNVGYNLLFSILDVPLTAILENAGKTPEKFLKGYDIFKGEAISDMYSIGVVDPYLVVKKALESAVSIVGTLLTTDGVIINTPDKQLKF